MRASASGNDGDLGPETVEKAFCFVDLAGFTALTDAHGDATAVALLDRFLEMTHESLGEHDELVKSIGDAVMLASPMPGDAVAVALGLLARCRQEDGFPLPRAGAHHGRAIARNHDYFGSAVNLAARGAGKAGGGQFLATGAVAEAARRRGDDVTAIGTHGLRNVSEPTELFEIGCGADASTAVVDPVCRMRLDRENAFGWLRHDGHEYWFCSLECLRVFATDPGRQVPAPAATGQR